MTAPAAVVWDITYACPLRCEHCYSEAGRRPSRQLSWPDLARVVDALVELSPRTVVLSGGEPLVVPEVFRVAERLRSGGVSVHLYTAGWHLPDRTVAAVVEAMSNVTVSIDGASAATHDRLRGRAGSFDRAMDAAARLTDAAAGQPELAVGVDYTVTRSNFDEIPDFCRLVDTRFPSLDYVFFGAAMPIGLASRKGFVTHEMVTSRQLELLRDESYADTLRTHLRADLVVSDNEMFQMRPERLVQGEIPAMQVEPDGRVRAMPVYEGTVGSLLDEPGTTLWQRAMARWDDPRVTSLLEHARTMEAWADATRRLDLMFGDADDQRRIERRPAFP
ncbi:radical SAM protein [Streptomyces sp. 11x1]|uniref:radical SAM protein n=1 Tax=Streptomyces sp. 11x1 TaxID=3038642 RepID=UPI00292CE04E|nr:radical SAM protein [Streptomyces sp. 11x1]WNZ06189.1 radical SAM protein [Streptomyces sp. 11x1]